MNLGLLTASTLDSIAHLVFVLCFHYALTKRNVFNKDPFQSDIPEVIEEWLDYRQSQCIAFNRRGTLLAAGCSDGAIVIWDFETRGVARCWEHHKGAVTTVSWSQNGRRLLSGSVDQTIVCWDVEAGRPLHAVQVAAPVISAKLHPKDSNICLVCPAADYPCLVQLLEGKVTVLPLSMETPPAPPVQPAATNGSNGRPNGQLKSVEWVVPVAVASFNKQGDLVFVGNAKGCIIIVDTISGQTISACKIAGGAAVKSVAFSRSGRYFLVNSADRVVRVYESIHPSEVGDHEASAQAFQASSDAVNQSQHNAALQPHLLRFKKEFKDGVNRRTWKTACFSGNGDYVIMSGAEKAQHVIYIYSTNFGQLVRMLEGPPEGTLDLACHPVQPIIASVASSGFVYIWAKSCTENWSAFAPDFKELEENEEYVEREDEFDLNREEEKEKVKKQPENEDVDVITEDPIPAFSDAEEDGLHFLPVEPEKDAEEPEDPSTPAQTAMQITARTPRAEAPMAETLTGTKRRFTEALEAANVSKDAVAEEKAETDDGTGCKENCRCKDCKQKRKEARRRFNEANGRGGQVRTKTVATAKAAKGLDRRSAEKADADVPQASLEHIVEGKVELPGTEAASMTVADDSAPEHRSVDGEDVRRAATERSHVKVEFQSEQSRCEPSEDQPMPVGVKVEVALLFPKGAVADAGCLR
eukprot:jgi/Chlat1/8430/Chrsp80S07845